MTLLSVLVSMVPVNPPRNLTSPAVATDPAGEQIFSEFLLQELTCQRSGYALKRAFHFIKLGRKRPCEPVRGVGWRKVFLGYMNREQFLRMTVDRTIAPPPDPPVQ